MQSSNNNYNNAESTISNSTNNNSKDDSDVRTAGKSVAIELSENNKKNKKPRKTCWLRRRINAIPLSTRLVACTLAILTVAAFCISLSIQQLVGNYLLEKTDVQLASQAQFVYDNVDSLRMKNSNQSSVGPNNYFMQVRDTHNKIISTPLIPIKGSVVSVPKLPADGFDSKKIVTHKPYTAPAIVKGNTNKVDAITKKAATAPWRVLVLTWGQKNSYNSELSVSSYVYIALSLSDQIDTVSTLTRYCIMVSIAVILFGAVFSAIIIQSALRPLKRIEKTASKIASGDLSKRVPSAPENTEVGSLAASLNSMLARIERGFNEQEDMAEKMKRFVSDASHELRTPLAAIHGYAELYTMWRNMPGEQERADDSIAHIKASSERMTELVEDLLSLARFDEGRGINISQQVSLSPILSDAANDLHALDPARSVQQGYLTISDEWKLMSCTNCDFERKLQFHVGTLPTVTLLGDGARLRQVMTNIVGNIHRYTPVDSPVEIAVGVMKASITPNELSKLPSVKESLKEFLEAAEVSQSTDTGHKYAVIRVVDHGPGVPEESLSRIFERFYIADPSRAREKGGTGLGMAIAQSVVKAHHGFICATISSPLEASTNSKTNLDDTMDGSEQIDVKAHGLTLTVVLPVNEIDEPSKIVND